MNHKVSSKVVRFWNKVTWYINHEYPDYFKFFEGSYINQREHFDKLWDMVYGYYLGGNNAEDTAGFMVEYLKLLADKKGQT
jgi:hypothetical protein